MLSAPRWILIFFTVILLIAFAWYFSNIVSYVLVAGVLSVIGQPLMEWLADKKIKNFSIPRALAALATMLVMLVISLLFLSIFIPLIASEAKSIAAINIQQLAATLEQPLQRVEIIMKELGMLGEHTLNEYINEKLKNLISITNISNLFGSIVTLTGDLFIAYLSITFILFFFLKEKNLFFNILKAFAPDKHEKNVDNTFKSIKGLLTRYFLGILAQITTLVIVISIGLSVAGLKNALLIAFFAGIFNIIPYVGPLFGATLGLLLGITGALPMELYPDMLILGAKIFSVFAVAQLLDNFILQPFIFSSSVRAHPLEIFLVILAGGTAGGVFGMVLAVPAYTIIRVVAKEFFSELKIVRELTGRM